VTASPADVQREHDEEGFNGRFGPGLPRVADGSLLFLLHLVKKLRPKAQGGGRAGIVLNGSPLFAGGAGSGESEIRRYLLENDLLEAIVALPTDMFYNTGIATYLWIIDNDKHPARRGTVQLIDGSGFSRRMRKALGSKRKELGADDIARIVRLYGAAEQSDVSKIFRNDDFGYRTITVERPLRLNWALTEARWDAAISAKPLASVSEVLSTVSLSAVEPAEVTTALPAFANTVRQVLSENGVSLTAPQLRALIAGLSERDESAPVITDVKGRPLPDADARETENVPLSENIQEYFAREVLPHVPDAWIDEPRTRVGYEIPFTRHFYKYVPPRPLGEIDADLNQLIAEITELLQEVES